MSLVSPRLSDDSLLCAMNSTRGPAIIVMEDVDALFNQHREKTEHTGLTFSGLLNAIDGVCDTGTGVIIIFTTNHLERLDPALRRKGRIDLIVHLGYVNEDMATRMFLKFYPGEKDCAAQFASNVKKFDNVSPSDLQHHFIINRNAAPKDAVTYSKDECDDARRDMYG